jgi:putative peptidoglycan lipid II flippase
MSGEPMDGDRAGRGEPGDPVAAEAVSSEAAAEAREVQPGDLSANPLATSGRVVARNSALMATGTVVSRVTGIGRDIALTAALGFYLVSDAYSLGNSLPTMVYILIIGGALNAVFIPQLVRRMQDDADDGKAYADRLLTLTATALLVLSVVAVIAAPWIVDLYTPADYPPEQYDLAVAFARLFLPQILFYGIYTMLSQVLNARGQFGAPMFAPIANNIIAIGTFLIFIAVAGTSAAADGVLTTDQVLLLGIGTTLGVVVQAVILIPVLIRSGHVWQLRFDWRDSGLLKAGRLAAWTVALVLVNQIAYLFIMRLAAQANVNASATDMVAAGITTYQKAHLVFMLPHSVITISIVTALLPSLARVAHAGLLHDVGRDIARAMRSVSVLIVPIAAILAVNGAAISILLFGYGAATPEQAAVMGVIVSVFMIGLPAFTLFYVLLRGFYALEDTRTPFFITVVFSAVMLALAFPLFQATAGGGSQVAALALAYSLSYWVGLVIAWFLLARRLGSMESGRTVWSLARTLVAGGVATVVMAVVSLLALRQLGSTDALTWETRLWLLLLVVLVSIVGLVVFAAAAWAMRVRELHDVLSLARRLSGRFSRRGGRS